MEGRANRDALIEKVEKELGYPVIVKPANLGSSVGIGKAANREELAKALDNAERISKRLNEEHMVGKLKEINCTVLRHARN